MTAYIKRHADRGAVLPLTLVFMVFGSLVVMALTTFAITLFRNRPPLEERSDSYEAVQAAMNMAITMQRSHGPEGCYPHTDDAFVINNRTVQIRCTVLEDENDLGGRYGLLTTSNVGLAGADDASLDVEGDAVVRNDAFIQGGSLSQGVSQVSLLDGSILTASESTESGLSAHRYTTVDAADDVILTAAATCGEVFGPTVAEEAFTNPDWTATPNLIATPTPALLPISVEIEPTTADVRFLGAIVTNADGTIVVHRDVPSTGNFVVQAETLTTITGVQTCIQVAVPDTDPDHIPLGRTFCEGPLMDPEQFQHTTSEEGVECLTESWWDVAGWKPTALANYIRPMLPQIPTYLRSTNPQRVGATNCYVFYPGRYSGEVTLDGGREYYVASGVYLFDSPIRISDGARVVGGEGRWAGCTFDAEASFLPGSPESHQITGKGVTFLLGDGAMLYID
ncbi:MAG: hypothetical protein AAGG08_14430, partial [Actinomycetota bacterium]